MKIPRTFVLTVNRPIPKYDATVEHLRSIGVPFERFDGMDNLICRLSPLDTFDVDRAGERINHAQVCACLTHYLLWKVMSFQPDDSFWALEYDVRFDPDWRARYEEALKVLPDDWDIVFLGSCCCANSKSVHIGNNLYEVKYPLCGHAMMYRKKALPVLLQEQQKIWAPLDIALTYGAFQKLKVYTILPRIIDQQHGTLPK